MATVTKDFKVKNGLIVEGTTGTINNHDILTKKQDDQDYIVGLIGGTSTSANTADTVVKRDANGDFAAGVVTADLVGDVTGNADTATALETARTITLAGDVTGSVSFDGTANVSITATIDGSFATDAEVATAKGEAISDANDYTDTREGLITTAYEAYADQAEVDAKAYTDTREGLITTAYEAYADQAESDAVTTANGYTDTREGLITTAYEAYADQAEVDAKAYTDTRETAITTAYQSYADTAEADAKTYADGLASTINGTIAALDTDDVAEGTAQYFTDARAKTSAASLLTGATLTNITISGNGSGLTITAENGVADSDTDDLVEGTTNLYFTDARAVSALEAVTPDFPAVEIASIAKQVAAEASVETASTNTAVSWAKASYRSAEFLVKIANGTHTEVSKVILTLDTSDNVAITEYAMVGTNGSLGSVSADVSGDDVRLRVTTVNNTSVVGVVGTLIK